MMRFLQIALVVGFCVLANNAFACPAGQVMQCHSTMDSTCHMVQKCGFQMVLNPMTHRFENKYVCNNVMDCTPHMVNKCECVPGTDPGTDPGHSFVQECSTCQEHQQFCGFYNRDTHQWLSGNWQACGY